MSKEKQDAVQTSRLLQNASAFFAHMLKSIRGFFVNLKIGERLAAYGKSLSGFLKFKSATSFIRLMWVAFIVAILAFFASVTGFFKKIFSGFRIYKLQVKPVDKPKSAKIRTTSSKVNTSTKKTITQAGKPSITGSGIGLSFNKIGTSFGKAMKKSLDAFSMDLKALGRAIFVYTNRFWKYLVTEFRSIAKSSSILSIRKWFANTPDYLKKLGRLLLTDLKIAWAFLVLQLHKVELFWKSKKTQDSLKHIRDDVSATSKKAWVYTVSAGKSVKSVVWSPDVKEKASKLGVAVAAFGVVLWKWIADPDFHKRIPRLILVIAVVLLVYWMLFGFPASRSNMIVNSIDPTVTAEAVRLELETRSLNAQILSGVAILALSFWFISFIMKEMSGNKRIDK